MEQSPERDSKLPNDIIDFLFDQAPKRAKAPVCDGPIDSTKKYYLLTSLFPSYHSHLFIKIFIY